MIENALILGVICLVLAVVGCGIAAWLYSMTDAGKNQQRGRELELW